MYVLIFLLTLLFFLEWENILSKLLILVNEDIVVQILFFIYVFVLILLVNFDVLKHKNFTFFWLFYKTTRIWFLTGIMHLRNFILISTNELIVHKVIAVKRKWLDIYVKFYDKTLSSFVSLCMKLNINCTIL